jgi:hypothetical protein
MKYFIALSATFLTACGLITPPEACERTDADTAAWVAAERSDSNRDYRAYLAEFPYGCYAGDAMRKLRRDSDNVSLPRVTAATVGSGGGNAY